MIVVADTGPLNYLILIEAIDVLPKLYGSIAVPPAVVRELQSESAPVAVRMWIASPPTWLQTLALAKESVVLRELDEGERQAIALAEEIGASLVVLDDWDGREEARRRGLEVVGTLGVLLAASRMGLMDFELALGGLRRTSFYLDDKLESELLRIWRKHAGE